MCTDRPYNNSMECSPKSWFAYTTTVRLNDYLNHSEKIIEDSKLELFIQIFKEINLNHYKVTIVEVECTLLFNPCSHMVRIKQEATLMIESKLDKLTITVRVLK